MQTAYRDLNNASRRLRKSGIEFLSQITSEKALRLLFVSIWAGVTTTKYHTKQGWVELTWNHKLVPHLLGLKREFTSYKLNQMAALRSVYSHRLLELLMMFECTGWAKFSLDDFCQSMQATPTQKKDFANIRRKIIEPAIKELCEKMAGKLNTKPSKQGEKLQAYTLLLNATSKKICFKYSSWIFEILKNSWGDYES